MSKSTPKRAKQTPASKGVLKLIEIRRHVTGPPRRAPGTRIFLTDAQIKEQGLKARDYKVVG